MIDDKVNRRELARRLSRRLYFAFTALAVVVGLEVWRGRWRAEYGFGLVGALVVGVMFIRYIRWLRSHPD